MVRIIVPLAEGFEEMEAVIALDTLRRAGFDVVSASLGQLDVTGSHAIMLRADTKIDIVNINMFDAIVLPGGMPGSRHLKESSIVVDMVKKIFAKDGIVGAICAAPIVLGKAGIVDGRRITCFPGEEKDIPGAVVTGNPVEIDGNIITGKGAGASFDFALAIVAALSGAGKANELRRRLQIHWN